MRLLIVISLLLTILLSSCSYIYGEHGIIQNRETDYLSAYQIAPIVVPPCYSAKTIYPHYPVPERCYPSSQNRVSITPPELYNPTCFGYTPPVSSPPLVTASAKPTTPAAKNAWQIAANDSKYIKQNPNS